MKQNKICRVCGVKLVAGENCTQNRIDGSHYICEDCRKEYYQNNRNHKREYNRKYNQKNRDRQREYQREYRQKNREHLCEQNRQYNQKNREHIRERQLEYRHKTGKAQPMNENKSCASYLGVHVAERVLSKVFKNVETMPFGNPGYDFVCNRGFKVDVKSACIRKNVKFDSWMFGIRKNKVADYFLMLAFDNRDDLNPVYMWLIPGGKLNHLKGTGISVTTLNKWDQYKLDVDKVIRCCDVIKDND